jgi:hypothetical protein
MNAESIYSKTGYVIQFAGCLVYWQSKLQTEIALSTAEAEYMALSQALRETLPTSNLMKEIIVIPTLSYITQVHYQNKRGQSVLHCNGKQSKVLSAYKTHCNQVSSFL